MTAYTPDLDDFRQAAGRGNLVPVFRELLADADTPVSAFAKLEASGEHPFLLESVVGGETWAAYSFIGVGARAVLEVRGGRARLTHFDRGGSIDEFAAPAPAQALQKVLSAYQPVPHPELPRFFGGAVGFFAYDVV